MWCASGSVTPDVATLTLTNALLTAGSFITIGNNTGATGTVNLNSAGADLLQSGTTADVIVGSSGTGTLNVTNGGLVDAADDVMVGNGTGSNGTLLVSGVAHVPEHAIDRDLLGIGRRCPHRQRGHGRGDGRFRRRADRLRRACIGLTGRGMER